MTTVNDWENPALTHIYILPWYAPHQAWVAQTYGASRHGFPEGTEPRRVDLSGADLRGANLSGATECMPIPVIPNIHIAIRDAVRTEGNRLYMANRHVCETTHCRAGRAIHLAGDAGHYLELRLGPAAAGALIYAASAPNDRVPNFYATDNDAMADIIRLAERDESDMVQK